MIATFIKIRSRVVFYIFDKEKKKFYDLFSSKSPSAQLILFSHQISSDEEEEEEEKEVLLLEKKKERNVEAKE